MAIFHRAELTPTKEELLTAWVPTQPWGAGAGPTFSFVGSYRFDDPEGRVGMEGHLLRADDGAVLHAPLTYRDAPLAGADDALITTMQHSVLGDRWVYDALHDPVYVTMLAAVAMTGQGESLGLVVSEGRWHIAPTDVRLEGGGWTTARVPVDQFVHVGEGMLRNDGFELRVHRRPVPQPRPPLALAARWTGQDDPVLLAAVRSLTNAGA